MNTLLEQLKIKRPGRPVGKWRVALGGEGLSAPVHKPTGHI